MTRASCWRVAVARAALAVAVCVTGTIGYDDVPMRHDEFEVKFGTKKTLGLKLDDHLKVRGGRSRAVLLGVTVV